MTQIFSTGRILCLGVLKIDTPDLKKHLASRSRQRYNTPNLNRKKSPSNQVTAVLLHLVKKGFLTTCLTTDSFGTRGNSGVKRFGEYVETSRNHRKWTETYRKNLVQPFGSRRPGVRVPALRPPLTEKPPI